MSDREKQRGKKKTRVPGPYHAGNTHELCSKEYRQRTQVIDGDSVCCSGSVMNSQY